VAVNFPEFVLDALVSTLRNPSALAARRMPRFHPGHSRRRRRRDDVLLSRGEVV